MFRALIVAVLCTSCAWDWDRYAPTVGPRGDGGPGPDGAAADRTGEGPLGPVGNFELVFREDCDGTRIDRTRWSTQYIKDGAPFPFYSWSGSAVEDDNVLVEGGVCRLRIERRSQNGRMYASAVLDSDGKFEMTHGHVEVRMRAARGVGIRSTFVMHHPTIWPPQVDVVRIQGSNTSRWSHGLWTEDEGGNEKYENEMKEGPDLAQDFHVYGLSWTPQSMDFWVDGQKTWSAPASAFPRLRGPLKIEITAHVAGNGEAPDATTVFPAYIGVDWVRGWKLR